MTSAEEIGAMLAKAARYIESAESLRRERDYDSAISRLYYAMSIVPKPCCWLRHKFSQVTAPSSLHLDNTLPRPSCCHP